jgi:choline dehydrogenase-like flavoprotein/pimeloyl-ACP methyl ester carboxylesterase
MAVRMTRISTTLAEARKLPPPGVNLGQTFDAIVVGSGYGGAIAAAKLVEAGQRVLLLERGREILPGDYPRSLAEAMAETQITTSEAGRLTKTNGMLDLRIHKDMSVVLGCGLGGTSLINANVALEPDTRLFEETEDGLDGQPRPVWPAALRGPLPPGAATMLDKEYAQAIQTLDSVPLPEAIKLPKLNSLEVSAKAMGLKVKRMPINVRFQDGPNHFGNYQAACTLCGDCCSGCNYGAKNTTLMNYLPYAAANGATLLTEAQVHWVAGADGSWSVRVSSFGQAAADGIDISAKLVVLAAGTLGSTEILSRSVHLGKVQAATGWLGKGFSGNGDVLGFGFNANWTQASHGTAAPIFSIGAGTNTPVPVTPPSAYPYMAGPFTPGPCIAGMIQVTWGDGYPVRKGVVIEDGVGPGPLSMAYPAIFFGDDVVNGAQLRFPDAARRLQAVAELGNTLMSGVGVEALAYATPMEQMQSYLLMSHDDAAGEIVYVAATDAVKVVWPGVGAGAPFARDNALLQAASDAIWADYLANPMWSEAFGWKVITTHPIGGCRMADDPAFGVVNSDCQVYTGAGTAVHDGLMVCDGAVIPGSLGVNPLLTISAVTIRAMDRLIARRGWRKVAALKPASSASPLQGPPAAPEDPLMAIVPVAKSAHVTLIDYVARIALSKAEALAVEKEIYKKLNVYVQSFHGTEKVALEAALEAAYEAADMQGDIGPALNVLATDIAKVIGALQTGGPDSEKLARLEKVLAGIVGDLSSGLTFSETMKGFVSTPQPGRMAAISDPFAVAEARGRAEGRALDGVFTVITADMERLVSDPDHKAQLSGVLTLSQPGQAKPLTLPFTGGTFELLREDGAAVDRFLMVYKADLPGGGQFHGEKTLQRREGSNWWTDLTTLATRLTLPGQDPMQGLMRLGVEDFVQQVGTVKGEVTESRTLASIVLLILRKVALREFKDLVAAPDFLNAVVRLFLNSSMFGDAGAQGAAALLGVREVEGAQLFATTIFRTYGGIAAYLNNFPAQFPTKNPMPNPPGTVAKTYPAVMTDGARVQLTRFRAGKKGPVILANGFGFRGMAFAADTNGTNPSLVAALAQKDFDVWIFDHRASPANMDAAGQVNVDYTMDDIAAIDWPWAVDFVRATRKAEGTDPGSVQLLAHCLGGLTAMMALQAGHMTNVRQMIVSQFTTQPVAGWFNQMKADLGLSRFIHGGIGERWAKLIGAEMGNPALTQLLEGTPVFDLRTSVPPTGTPTPAQSLDLLINTALWNVPFPPGESCYNPTCHRVFGVFGPVYSHAQLTDATHDALNEIAGPVATLPFDQLALIMQAGRALDAKGKDVYFGAPERLNFPIHFISGALNQLVMPETTLRSQRWLQGALPGSASQFTREVFAGYGHLDCLIGRNAAHDVFPSILAQLEAHP